MSEYQIKSYDESYIEKQVEIGTSFAERWIGYGQTQVERLKEVYSRENFDPETRLYCFKGDELVGFIGANVVDVEDEDIKRADTRLAFVLPGHEDAFDLLFNQLVEVLKKKEVSRIETFQTILHDNYYELAEGLGFSYNRTITEIYTGTPDAFKLFETELDVFDYNHETDADGIKKFLKEAYPNLTDERIENYVNRIPENEAIYVKKVIRKDGELLAFCCAINTQTPNQAQITTLLGKSSDYKKHAVSAVMAESKDKEKVVVFLDPNNPVDAEEARDFLSMGYEKAADFDVLRKEI
jgi:hypothetical protein